MARKLRLEYPGAVYHVINRGNYRAWVFRNDKTKAAFAACVFDACTRYQWVLHAYVVMGNHYHLAIETPQGNLVVGMQWLQATFGNRFNKLRGEHGHVFQGRYKALLVEQGEAVGQVCHYIHLNPVRASIAAVPELGQYRYSSYWYLTQPKERPKFLNFESALTAAGQLPDTPEGWRSYRDYLAWQAAEGPAGKNAAYVSMTSGWAIGSEDFKEALIEDHDLAAETKAWRQEGALRVRRARWGEALNQTQRRLPSRLRRSEQKSAPWKVALAGHLKETTDVSNGWLAEHLQMGSATYVSKHVGLLRTGKSPEAHRLLEHLRVKGTT